MTFISLMVDRRYTATQYALLASIGTASRTLLAASSGMLVDWLGSDWGLFFIITALMVTPSLVLLLLIAPGNHSRAKRVTGRPSLNPGDRFHQWFAGSHRVVHIGVEQGFKVCHDGPSRAPDRHAAALPPDQ